MPTLRQANGMMKRQVYPTKTWRGQNKDFKSFAQIEYNLGLKSEYTDSNLEGLRPCCLKRVFAEQYSSNIVTLKEEEDIAAANEKEMGLREHFL